MPTFTSFGAAGEVTGSKHLIAMESGNRVLLDCGLFQGKRETATQKNIHFGFDPETINAVLLSHAHIDHIGLVPKLSKDGFNGRMYSTVGTMELASPMLFDTAHIQEEDEAFIRKHHIPNPFEGKIPLFTQIDVEHCLPQLIGKPYHLPFEVAEDISAEFVDAGHVFGSAITIVTLKTPQGRKKLVYTGDLGRNDLPILNDPVIVGEADYLVIESTYGDRKHEGVSELERDLQTIITRTIKRGGKVFIPAFALERTQEVILRLEELMHEGKIPRLQIFVDSPLAQKITKIFEDHPEYYDLELKSKLKKRRKIFSFDNLDFTESVEDSKRLNSLPFPAIIIAGSGMMESGRIRHHIKNNIEDPKNTFLIVGYQAEETLGRNLMEGRKVIRVLGQDLRVNAEIVTLKSLSAHADMRDLDQYAKKIKGLKKIFLVHGEESSREAFAKRLSRSVKGAEIILPKFGESYEL